MLTNLTSALIVAFGKQLLIDRFPALTDVCGNCFVYDFRAVQILDSLSADTLSTVPLVYFVQVDIYTHALYASGSLLFATRMAGRDWTLHRDTVAESAADWRGFVSFRDFERRASENTYLCI